MTATTSAKSKLLMELIKLEGDRIMSLTGKEGADVEGKRFAVLQTVSDPRIEQMGLLKATEAIEYMERHGSTRIEAVTVLAMLQADRFIEILDDDPLDLLLKATPAGRNRATEWMKECRASFRQTGG